VSGSKAASIETAVGCTSAYQHVAADFGTDERANATAHRDTNSATAADSDAIAEPARGWPLVDLGFNCLGAPTV
jgi:hypothetical protein